MRPGYVNYSGLLRFGPISANAKPMVNCILCRLEVQSAKGCDRYGCPVSYCSGTQWGDTVTLPLKALMPDWEDEEYEERIEIDEDDDEIGAEWDFMSQYDLDGEEDDEEDGEDDEE